MLELPPDGEGDCTASLRNGATANRSCTGRRGVWSAATRVRFFLAGCARSAAVLCTRDERTTRGGTGGADACVVPRAWLGGCAAAAAGVGARGPGFDGGAPADVARAGFDTGGDGSGLGSGSEGKVTAGGSGGCVSSARAFAGMIVQSTAVATHTTVRAGSARRKVPRVHLGGFLMAGPSAVDPASTLARPPGRNNWL